MATVSIPVQDSAIFHEENERYWCGACDTSHAEWPEHVADGYHTSNVECLGDYYTVVDGTETSIYQCEDGHYMDEEDWYGMDAYWACPVCGSEYSYADYDEDEAEKLARMCCLPEKTRRASFDQVFSTGTTTASVTYPLEKIVGQMTTMASVSTTAAAALEHIQERFNRRAGSVSISAEDVTADAFK